jgi:very-short-patch-repair endonuclease
VGSSRAGQPSTKLTAREARQVDCLQDSQPAALWEDEVLWRVLREGLTGELVVARLAELQRGLATRAQLLAVGLSETEIHGRIERGLLHSVHRGVYRVGHTAPLEFAAETAAVLACGSRTVLSGRSAGYVWALLPRPHGPVQVSGAVRRKRPGIRARRVPVGRSEVARCRGIPITSVARTVVDLAGELDPPQLESVVAEAERRRLVKLRDLAASADLGSRRRGARKLRELLHRGHDPALTRFDTEKRFLRLVRAARLPAPDHNTPFGAYELDTVWRGARLVVELDGYEFHRTRGDFERDRARDAELQASGFAVLRFTWRQVRYQPELVLARLVRTLALREGL